MSSAWSIISEHDLGETKVVGDSVRARCPIHHSRDYDLSIAPPNSELAGFGHCFSANCDATVLVKEWNPKAAEYALHSLSDGLHVREYKKQKQLVVTNPVASRPKEWQVTLLEALKKLHPLAQEKISHPRALAYLHERGCSESVDLLASLGVGYIPPVEEWKKEPPASILRWCDRFIFPLTDDSGQRGFIARSLQFWQPGMDENEHKKLLDEHDKGLLTRGENPLLRWRKTYITGFFHARALKQSDTLLICEGTWDAIALYCIGITNVVASGGTAMNKLVKGIPPSVKHVVIAFDSDVKTSERYQELFGRVGLSCKVILAPDDGMGKDWSERYRRHGPEGLTPLLPYVKEDKEEPSILCNIPPTQESETVLFDKPLCASCLDETGRETVALHEPAEDGCMYCKQHHPVYNQIHEQFTQTVAQIANIFPGNCQIETVNCSAAEYIAQRQAEITEQNQQAQQAYFAHIRSVRQAARDRLHAKWKVS